MNTRAPGVEGVDHHLRLGRAGDLDPPVVEVGRRRGDGPVGLADRARAGQEVERLPGGQRGLALLAAMEQVEPDGAEPALQVGDEGQGVVGQDAVRARDRRARDDDARAAVISPRRGGRSPR